MTNNNIGGEQIRQVEEQIRLIDEQIKNLREYLDTGSVGTPVGNRQETLLEIARLQGEKLNLQEYLNQIRQSGVFESEAQNLLKEISNRSIPANAETIARWASRIPGLSAINQNAAVTELRIRVAEVMASDPNALEKFEKFGVDPAIWQNYDNRAQVKAQEQAKVNVEVDGVKEKNSVEHKIDDLIGKMLGYGGEATPKVIGDWLLEVPRQASPTDRADIDSYIVQMIWRTYGKLDAGSRGQYLASLESSGFGGYLEAVKKNYDENKAEFKEDKKEADTKLKIQEVSQMRLSNDNTGMLEIKRLIDVVGSDKEAQKVLKGKIKAFYRSLDTGEKRWKFVEMARSSMISKDFVGEELWESTNEILEINKEAMEDARKLIRQLISDTIASSEDADKVWVTKILPDLRKRLPIGLSREAEEMLKNEFVLSLNETRRQSGAARALDRLSTILVDTVVSQFASKSKPELHDPYVGGRDSLGMELVMDGRPPRIDLGAVERTIRFDISNPPIGMSVNDPRFEGFVSQVMESVGKQINTELKDINELQKKIRELNAAERKLNKARMDQMFVTAGSIAKFAGGVVMAGTGLFLGFSGIQALVSNMGTGGSSMLNIFGTGGGLFGLGAILPGIREAYSSRQEQQEKIQTQVDDIAYLQTEVGQLEAKTGFERAGRRKVVKNWFEENLRGMGPDILDSKAQEFLRTSAKPLQLATI
jgi:hypothetical protein